MPPQQTDLLNLLNPKNYKYLPATYTNNIRFAGRQTADSDHVGQVITHKFK